MRKKNKTAKNIGGISKLFNFILG